MALDMKTTFSLILICLTFLTADAQENSTLEYIEAITVEVDRHNQVFYKHSLKPKETAYSLARYFDIPVADLLLLNRIKSDDVLPIGTEIVIPIKKSLIRTPLAPQSDNWVPVLYTVAKQETPFKIANSYFPQPIQNLIKRNDINTFSLKVGRNLIVGWWGPEQTRETVTRESKVEVIVERTEESRVPIKRNTEIESKVKEDGPAAPNRPRSARGSIADIIRNKIIKRGEIKKDQGEETERSPEEVVIINNRDTTKYDPIYPTQDTIISDIVVEDTLSQEIEEPVINYKSGIATWDKQGFDRENLFVMHDEAKPNSYIRLKHPVTQKEVTALVLCAIPTGIHASEVDIVLSPAVAIALGALNSQFKIEMDYYQ